MRRRDFLGLLAAAPLQPGSPAHAAFARAGVEQRRDRQSAPPPPRPTLAYAGALQQQVIVFDEAQEKVIERIPLQTGVPRRATLSFDKKKLYIFTVKDSGVEVVDLPGRKVTNHFTLNEPDRKYRISGFAPEPQDKLLYVSFTTADKKTDRFEITKPKFGVIDLVQKKIVRTIDFPKDQESPYSAFGAYRVSPDGKFLYVFRDHVYVYDTANFKQVEKIELSKPLDPYPWMETINLGPGEDPHDDANVITGLFNATDPIVRRSIFGIARIDLMKRSFDFTPVGPSGQGMMGLRLTPDRKFGYTVAFQGTLGNRRSEFWVFDLSTRAIVKRMEFAGPINFRFSLSGTGKQIYTYGSAPVIEVWDADTLKLKKTIDVNADLTTGLVVVP